jgi:DNA-binding HxlR family transcriptional regulator
MVAKPLKAHAKHTGSHTAAASPSTPATRLGHTKLSSVNGQAVDTLAPMLDRLIHERLRLGIVSALAVNDTLSFNELKQLMNTTDGNLSVHARRLEEAKYIQCTKTFEDRVPHTQYVLTPLGRQALAQYLNHMEALIHATRER